MMYSSKRRGVPMMQLAENLFNLRRQNGFSQEELADKCGVSRQAIAKWENEESLPTIEKLILIADLYNVSLDELVGRNEKDKYEQLRELLKQFIAKDLPQKEDEDISKIVVRFLTFANRMGLNATDSLNGLAEVFLQNV